jgi:cell division protein FtsQ
VLSWGAVRTIATALTLAAAAILVARALLLSPQFHVNRIVVKGNERLARGEVVALLGGLQGQHLLAVNLETWRGKLLESPWVADARLHRVLPGTVEVLIVERTPMAIARVRDRLFLVDAAGRAIDEYGPQYQDLDLPIVDGLAAATDDPDPDVQARAALVSRMVSALSGRADLYRRVSQIDVRDDRNAIVILDEDGTRVHLGDSAFAERLQSYVELAPSLRSRLAQIDYVDLRFEPRVFVRPMPGSGLAKATTASLP